LRESDYAGIGGVIGAKLLAKNMVGIVLSGEFYEVWEGINSIGAVITVTNVDMRSNKLVSRDSGGHEGIGDGYDSLTTIRSFYMPHFSSGEAFLRATAADAA
jgi:basic membrane lipoprotein Med (substrate-binding protein (PBP1-ABC) superfamily)